MWFYEISLLRGVLSLHPARSAYLLAVWYLQVCLRLLFLNMRIGEGVERYWEMWDIVHWLWVCKIKKGSW